MCGRVLISWFIRLWARSVLNYWDVVIRYTFLVVAVIIDTVFILLEYFKVLSNYCNLPQGSICQWKVGTKMVQNKTKLSVGVYYDSQIVRNQHKEY